MFLLSGVHDGVFFSFSAANLFYINKLQVVS